jgi:hypothetical protein
MFPFPKAMFHTTQQHQISRLLRIKDIPNLIVNSVTGLYSNRKYSIYHVVGITSFLLYFQQFVDVLSHIISLRDISEYKINKNIK